MNLKKAFKKAAITTAALSFWILIWFLLSKKVSSIFILPSPLEVFPRILEIAATCNFYQVLAASFIRIMLGFVLGSFFGFLLGFFTYYIPFAKAIFSPLMSIIRATPVASFILVVIFWVERDLVPTVISLLMVLPIVWKNTELGLEQRDGQLTELAKVYRFGAWKTLFRIDLPQVIPFVSSACETSLGLAWKAGVAAEVLALPNVSVGEMIFHAKLILEMADHSYSTVVGKLPKYKQKKLLEEAEERDPGC